jgi:hypothetical protein
MLKRDVIVQLLGGLGNQMFQYATGLRIASDFGVRVKIDTSILLDHSPGTHQVHRNFDLGLFSLSPSFPSPSERWVHNAHGLPAPVRAIRRALSACTHGKRLIESSYRFHPEILTLETPPRYISGLWQSWKYFKGRETEIRREFSFRHEIPKPFLEVGNALRRKSSVSIHVRRGDYVTNPVDAATLGFVGLEYYQRAVAIALPELDAKAKFYLFSDDLEWCRENFDWLPGEVTFVDSRTQSELPSHHLDFQLLSQSSNFILSNSTFAWWAAWLSPSVEKFVIAPKKWFQDPTIDSTDLCPPTWTLV